MQIIAAGFLIAMSGAWFWCCYVYFTQDYRCGWKEMMVWVIVAALIRLPVNFWVMGIDDKYLAWGGRIAGLLAAYAILYLVLTLRFHVEEIGRKLKILAAHLVGMQILALPIRFVS